MGYLQLSLVCRPQPCEHGCLVFFSELSSLWTQRLSAVRGLISTCHAWRSSVSPSFNWSYQIRSSAVLRGVRSHECNSGLWTAGRGRPRPGIKGLTLTKIEMDSLCRLGRGYQTQGPELKLPLKPQRLDASVHFAHLLHCSWLSLPDIVCWAPLAPLQSSYISCLDPPPISHQYRKIVYREPPNKIRT
ncbi:hypothetical protein ASPTUDRAFT_618130 [Aspergillus tubingensis CBS 134.48]|uniref:Uncharacterized protein n=1 Tax=Aspergillus tubingensis (strain CBS 134.48) TaxID=767770 RepID=A0A1L9N3S5_ASPTC|nr:hypothetical protein ASPTUDRAFT_618130 [Aspergillus tubingensis CBS 134.48]